MLALELKIIPGQLPSFWDKGVIFFANLHSLFFGNKAQTKILIRELGGISSYGGRLLSILGLLYRKKPNLIFLETAPDESLLEYMTNRLGLTLPEMQIMTYRDYRYLSEHTANRNLEQIEPFMNRVRTHQAQWLDGFVTDSTLSALAERTAKPTISSFNGSKNGNNKLLLHYHLLEKGLPVFDTIEAFSPGNLVACFDELKKRGYKKAVLKSQIGASGFGLKKYDMNTASSENFSEYFFFEGPCMVQGWLDEKVKGVKRIGSPSVQMFISEEELSLFDITEQFLREDSVHEGNISPPPYLGNRPDIREELLSQAAEAGYWLHRQGYRGTASTDFLVINRDGSTTVLICEINARVTGATYPAILARYFLPYGAWIMKNFRFHTPYTGLQLLSELDHGGLLFNKNLKKGILPFNFNLDSHGKIHKGQFIFLASTPEECENLLNQMQAVFPDIWKYDRD